MKNMNIEIKTLCDKTQRGTIVANRFKDVDKHMRNKNMESDYIEKNKEELMKSKSVDEMNPYEIYNHTITMIAGVDIVCKSNICISDYQSNVGRFIKLFHNKSENVFSVDNPNSDIDYNKKVCPAYSF
jgi:ABC-type metal ion transport system substrate-binding protein